MSPEFAQAVDPVFLYVLELLGRMEQGQPVARDDERRQLSRLLEEVESLGGQGPDAQLAKYALASWIDELFILTAPWDHRDWWKDHTLEWEMFQSQLRAEQFFVRGREAAQQRKKDALEVYYLAVILGFRGLYATPEREILARSLQLPDTIEEWARQTALTIQAGKRPQLGPPRTVNIEGAPPLDGPFTLIWASVAALVLVLANALVLLANLGK